MNEAEARELLSHRVAELRLLPYRELQRFLDKPQSTDVVHSSGRRYQIELEVFWDDGLRENLRVSVSIDDGGWRSFVPLTYGFVKRPDDQFVGE